MAGGAWRRMLRGLRFWVSFGPPLFFELGGVRGVGEGFAEARAVSVSPVGVIAIAFFEHDRSVVRVGALWSRVDRGEMDKCAPEVGWTPVVREHSDTCGAGVWSSEDAGGKGFGA